MSVVGFPVSLVLLSMLMYLFSYQMDTVQVQVLSPLNSLLSLFQGPQRLIQKRNDKCLDYDRWSNKIDKIRDRDKLKTVSQSVHWFAFSSVLGNAHIPLHTKTAVINLSFVDTELSRTPELFCKFDGNLPNCSYILVVRISVDVSLDVCVDAVHGL